jgi:type II secretory pathway pseudopilin PulG
MKNFINTKLSGRKIYSGFSLLELLIYVAVIAIVISAVVGFGSWAIQVGTRTRVNSEVINNARLAMDTMVYEIKKSASVYAPTSTFSVHPGQLSLEQLNATTTESASFLDFFICGQSLCLKREGQATVAITNSQVRVTNLVFKQLLNSASAPSIQIILSVSSLPSARSEGNVNLDLTTTASLRSY